MARKRVKFGAPIIIPGSCTLHLGACPLPAAPCAVLLPQVSVDADQVRIPINNLLANAVKFTPAGGIVEVSYRNEPAFVEFSIRDRSVRMPAELLRTILSPQSHAPSTYGTENEKGIGLGMLLVRDFAEQNHIALSAKSTPGQGAMFHLVFQLA